MPSTRITPNTAAAVLDTEVTRVCLRLRGNEVPHEPEESDDHERQTLHGTRRLCAVPGSRSEREMSHDQWRRERE